MKKHLYKEVYIVCSDSTLSVTGELTIFSTFEKLLAYLKTKNVSINSDLRVLHGVLTSARSIPKDIQDRQPFIILKDSDQEDQGIVLDSNTENDFNELAVEIEKTLEREEVASFFFEIDDIFILYGYEISLTLSADEDDVDEDIIIKCLLVGDEAEKLNKGDD